MNKDLTELKILFIGDIFGQSGIQKIEEVLPKFIEQEKSLDKTFILALDNDEAGQIATKALIEYFDENNINYCTFDNCGYKDANQALVSDKEKFTEEINKIVFPLIKEREHRKAKQFDDEME